MKITKKALGVFTARDASAQDDWPEGHRWVVESDTGFYLELTAWELFSGSGAVMVTSGDGYPISSGFTHEQAIRIAEILNSEYEGE